jgi:uncharacterized membrane protein
MSFIFSVIALLLGPFVYLLANRRKISKQIFDGLIFITIAGIVCVYIIPQSIQIGGILAIIFVAFGLIFPYILENLFDRFVKEAHVLILILAIIGLIVHAIIDGIALLPSELINNETQLGSNIFGLFQDRQLAIGVVLHRLPVGMAIWWSVQSNFGTRTTVAVFTLIIVCTAISYFLSPYIIGFSEAKSLYFFQAFVAGSLVHMAAFGSSHDHHSLKRIHYQDGGWAYRVGILLGMFLIFSVPYAH